MFSQRTNEIYLPRNDYLDHCQRKSWYTFQFSLIYIFVSDMLESYAKANVSKLYGVNYYAKRGCKVVCATFMPLPYFFFMIL